MTLGVRAAAATGTARVISPPNDWASEEFAAYWSG